MIVSVIGGDPGSTAGLCLLDYYPVGPLKEYTAKPEKTLIQCDATDVVKVLEWVLAGRAHLPIVKRFAGVEKWTETGKAPSRTKAADTTRQGVMRITECLELHGYRVMIRTASEVKTWANDKRLKAAGIVGESAIHGKARDAYDAERHALHCARWDALMRDPLA